jgi:hypothetical protein
MTRSYKPKPTPPDGPRPKRTAGVLSCSACKRTIPYQGYADPDIEPWPKHKCPTPRGPMEVRDFDLFSDDDPYRPALPAGLKFP